MFPYPAQTPGGAEDLLEVAVERLGSLVQVRLAGSLDVYTVAELGRRLAGLDLAGITPVVDLREVGLIDSSGLGALVRLRNEAARQGRRVGLVCRDRRQAGLFTIAGLDSAFVIGSSLEEVCGALGPAAAGGSPPPAALRFVAG